MSTNNCPKEAYCINTEYSYYCKCEEGYCGECKEGYCDDDDGCECFKIGKVEIVDSSLTLFMSHVKPTVCMDKTTRCRISKLLLKRRYTIKPLNKGHLCTEGIVPYSKVVPY